MLASFAGLVHQRPDYLVLALPHFHWKLLLECFQQRLDALIHDAKCLRGPEVSPRHAVLVVFEQESIPDCSVEHELQWWAHTSRDSFCDVREAAQRIFELAQDGRHECLWAVDVVLCGVVDIQTGSDVWVALNIQNLPAGPGIEDLAEVDEWR